MIGRENGNPQNISEGKEQKEVKPGQLLLPGSLLELQIGSSEEEVAQNSFEAIERTGHFFLLGLLTKLFYGSRNQSESLITILLIM